MGEALDLSADTLVDRDGNIAGLKVGSPFTIGGVQLTAAVGTVNTLTFSGALLSGHDALYAYAVDMQHNGTLVPESAQDVGFPRISLADAATQRVKWAWAIPAAWNSVAVRFGWCKEAAGSGNVKWQFAYRLVYPFTGEDVDASAVTTVDLGAIAVSGTTFGLQYEIPAAIQALATADGAFGSKPFLLCSLSRLGADGTDNYAAAVAVLLATCTRIS
jgi:hypothetical protein